MKYYQDCVKLCTSIRPTSPVLETVGSLGLGVHLEKKDLAKIKIQSAFLVLWLKFATPSPPVAEGSLSFFISHAWPNKSHPWGELNMCTDRRQKLLSDCQIRPLEMVCDCVIVCFGVSVCVCVCV